MGRFQPFESDALPFLGDFTMNTGLVAQVCLRRFNKFRFDVSEANHEVYGGVSSARLQRLHDGFNCLKIEIGPVSVGGTYVLTVAMCQETDLPLVPRVEHWQD